MLRHNVLISSLALLSALSTGCLGASVTGKNAPATMEVVGDTGLKRITLTAKAAQRIGLATANVREGYVYQSRRINGEVTELGVANDAGMVAGVVSVKGLQLGELECERNVRFIPVSDYDWSRALAARMASTVLASGGDAASVSYLFESGAGALSVGARVLVELCIAGTEGQARVIPHSALLFSADGNTWVYTEESPLTYIRAPVDVAWIDGADVILKNGPPVGSAVVTAGSVELFGEEFGIGK